MIIFKCSVTGDELFSDAFKLTYDAPGCHECMVAFNSKLTSEKSGDVDDSLIGGNKSAEGEDDEGVEASNAVSALDVVHAHILKEITFNTKQELKDWFKDYLKGIKKKLPEDPDKCKARQKQIVTAFNWLCEKLKSDELTCFQGESQQYESTILFAVWNEDGMSATCYAFIDSLDEEKC